MPKMTDDWYRNAAREHFGRPRTDPLLPALEVDPHAEVSKGTYPGAWVAAWIWIPFPREDVTPEPEEKADGTQP